MKRIYKLCLFGILALFLNSCYGSSEKLNDVKVENETIESILSRKSVRDFTSQLISEDTIEILLKSAMSAPTAVNKQPWKFVVVTNRLKLDELSDSLPYAKMIKKAPLAIIVCGNVERFLEGDAREYWVQDCSAATENLLLAAHSLGLGAVWTGAYPNIDRVEVIRKVLGLDSRLIPLCAVPIGYPAENPDVKNKWNKENIIYIK